MKCMKLIFLNRSPNVHSYMSFKNEVGKWNVLHDLFEVVN